MRLARGGDHSTQAGIDLLVPRAPAFFYDPRRGCDPEKVHPDTFYDDNQARMAREICRRCPFHHQCDQWATEHHEQWGMWGGRPRHPRMSRRFVEEESA